MEKKAKFTLIDLLIILVLAAVLVIGVMKIGPIMIKTTGNEKVEFIVQITNKEKGFSQAMHLGDRVTLSLTEKDGGTIKNIETKPAESLVFDSLSGNYKIASVDTKEDIYVTVEADCTVNDLAISTGDTKIKVGSEIPVRGKGYATTGFVIVIK